MNGGGKKPKPIGAPRPPEPPPGGKAVSPEESKAPASVLPKEITVGFGPPARTGASVAKADPAKASKFAGTSVLDWLGSFFKRKPKKPPGALARINPRQSRWRGGKRLFSGLSASRTLKIAEAMLRGEDPGVPLEVAMRVMRLAASQPTIGTYDESLRMTLVSPRLRPWPDPSHPEAKWKGQFMLGKYASDMTRWKDMNAPWMTGRHETKHASMELSPFEHQGPLEQAIIKMKDVNLFGQFFVEEVLARSVADRDPKRGAQMALDFLAEDEIRRIYQKDFNIILHDLAEEAGWAARQAKENNPDDPMGALRETLEILDGRRGSILRKQLGQENWEALLRAAPRLLTAILLSFYLGEYLDDDVPEELAVD